MDLLDTVVGQSERDQLADTVVGNVPANRASGLRQQFGDPQVGQRVDLEAAQRSRDHHSVEAGLAHLRDQGFRHALFALDLVMAGADHRLHRQGSLHQRLRVNIFR